jgi:hypothetical protein
VHHDRMKSCHRNEPAGSGSLPCVCGAFEVLNRTLCCVQVAVLARNRMLFHHAELMGVQPGPVATMQTPATPLHIKVTAPPQPPLPATAARLSAPGRVFF